jgi:hypothetical protein
MKVVVPPPGKMLHGLNASADVHCTFSTVSIYVVDAIGVQEKALVMIMN